MTTSAELPPSDLWVQITAMPRPHRVVDFPRVSYKGEPMGQMSMRLLTQEEQITTAIEAERFARKHVKDTPNDGPSRGYDDVYNNQAACEILFCACRRVGDMALPFFPSSSAIRQNMTPDEVGVLVRSYYIVQDEVGPIVATMSLEDAEAWVTRIRDGESGVPLAYLSPEATKQIVLSLASKDSAASENTEDDVSSQ